jgi:hypothetical protein
MKSLHCLHPYPRPQEPAMATQCDPSVSAGWAR